MSKRKGFSKRIPKINTKTIGRVLHILYAVKRHDFYVMGKYIEEHRKEIEDKYLPEVSNVKPITEEDLEKIKT